jgi:hypothetical protein
MHECVYNVGILKLQAHMFYILQLLFHLHLLSLDRCLLLIKFAKFWAHLCFSHKQHSRFFFWVCWTLITVGRYQVFFFPTLVVVVNSRLSFFPPQILLNFQPQKKRGKLLESICYECKFSLTLLVFGKVLSKVPYHKK